MTVMADINRYKAGGYVHVQDVHVQESIYITYMNNPHSQSLGVLCKAQRHAGGKSKA